jgi:hypothetical protein
MTRTLASACFIACLLLTGCAREEDYLQVMHEQQDAMKELADVLETVRDGESMAKAKVALQQLKTKFAAIAQKANALPKPPPRKVLERMDEEKHITERRIDRLRSEVGRISKMPGGAELWNQFESDSPGLFPAGAP